MKTRLRCIREAVSLNHALKTWKAGGRWELAPHHIRLLYLFHARGSLNKYQIYTALHKMDVSMNPEQINRALTHLQSKRLVREVGKFNGIMRYNTDAEGDMALVKLEEQIRGIRWDRIDIFTPKKGSKK